MAVNINGVASLTHTLIFKEHHDLCSCKIILEVATKPPVDISNLIRLYCFA